MTVEQSGLPVAGCSVVVGPFARRQSVQYDEPIATFLKAALALNKAVTQQKGLEPLLSTATYDYGFDTPDWGWEEIGKRLEEVEAGLDALPAERRPFVGDLLKSFNMMVREGLGESIPYGDRVATYLQVPGERIAQSTIDRLADELRQRLSEAGYPDDLSVAIPQWREGQMISGPGLAAQGQAFLDRARAETQRRIWPLPDGHNVVLTFPQNYPYRGYSDYSRNYQGRVFLNGDVEWELPSLKHVVCHEAFPGHQTFSAIREYLFRHGEMPVEGTLYFSNTPITPIVEGICEVGQEALGMMETVDDWINESYSRYSRAISTNLCFDDNEGLVDEETTVQTLMDSTYVSRVFAEKRYRFWTHPLWCTGFPHYYNGFEFMRESYHRMQDHLPAFFRMVYAEPHTVRTLREAIDAHLRNVETA
jgi:hypothetical protein